MNARFALGIAAQTVVMLMLFAGHTAAQTYIAADIVAKSMPDGYTLFMSFFTVLTANVGYKPTGTTPEQLAAIIKAETAVWAKVIKDAGIRAE